MLRSTLTACAVAVTVLLGGGSDGASAQTYDGGAVIKFGTFGQWGKLGASLKTPLAASGSESSFQGGLSVGMDFYLPYRWLLGVEVDGSFGDTRADVAGPGGTINSYGLDYVFNTRARVGYFMHPDWLAYGTVGASWLAYETQQRPSGFKESETAAGIVYGAGLEYQWHHVLVFAEYLHGSYDTSALRLNTVEHRADLDTDTFRVGLKFKVGHDYEHVGRHYDPEPLK